MQPRSLQQVLTELDSVYNPQIDNLRTRQAGLPGQMQAEEQGLKAQESDYFDNTIMADARRRGVGFGGIPQGERARYGATQFLPALARLKQQSKDQAMSLEDAILGIQERRNTQGQSIYEGERNFGEQQRQFNAQQQMAREQMAASQRAASVAAQGYPSNGYIAPGGGQPPQSPQKAVQGSYGFKNGKDGAGGFSFRDAKGNQLSAYDYAKLNGANFNDLLTRMASSGDVYARSALNSMGGAGAIDQNKYRWLFKTTAAPSGGSGGW